MGLRGSSPKSLDSPVNYERFEDLGRDLEAAGWVRCTDKLSVRTTHSERWNGGTVRSLS